jgi:hypothetical protein
MIQFRIKDVTKTVGSAGLCPVGKMIGPEFMKATLIIGADGMPVNKIAINHLVLRNALLNSPEILKEMKLEVVDLLNKPEQKAKPKQSKAPKSNKEDEVKINE